MYFEHQQGAGSTISHVSFTSTLRTARTSRSKKNKMKMSSPVGLIVSTSDLADGKETSEKHKIVSKAKDHLKSIRAKEALRFIEVKETLMKLLRSKFMSHVRSAPKNLFKETKRYAMKKYYRRKNRLDGKNLRSERGYLIEVDDESTCVDQFEIDTESDTSSESIEQYFFPDSELDENSLIEK